MIETPFSAAQEAANYLKTISSCPKASVVLGSGLGAFGEILEDVITIPYEDIPHFNKSKVKGHAGSLVIGSLPNHNTRVAAFCGRTHLYEGLHVSSIVHPTRTFALWGGAQILFTNAAGAINPNFSPGDLMMIND